MHKTALRKLERELGEYIESIVGGLGRVERRLALGAYLTGLLLDGERKSVEPMAGRLVDDPGEIEAMRQRMLQAVSVAEWAEQEVFRRLATKLDAELPGIEALVVDDTGFPKKGRHSVGVHRQYSGTLGRVENCQVAVSLHLASEQSSGCIDFRLFLPEVWASDPVRRAAVGVPTGVEFKTKPQIALAQIDAALSAGVRHHTVLTDAGYGDSTQFREELAARGLHYVTGIYGEIRVWPPGSSPRVPRQRRRGDRRTRHRDDAHPPIAVKTLAAKLEYRTVGWREGAKGWQSSRFAAVRLRCAHRHTVGAPPGEEIWLLSEWPAGEERPTRYWLSNLPASTSIRALVRLAKLRWRIERDYQEMKQEVGLDHYEGRSWRGFHHHVALCAAAHAFLALRRALFPPEQRHVDSTDSPASASAGASGSRWVLPSLPTRRQRSGSARGAFTNLIE